MHSHSLQPYTDHLISIPNSYIEPDFNLVTTSFHSPPDHFQHRLRTTICAMRRGFDQATSQPSSRPIHMGSGEPSQRPSTRARRAEYEASAAKQGTEGQRQPRTIAARRKSAQQPTLPLPQQSSQPQETSERGSPAYLQGKNPYVVHGSKHMRYTDCFSTL